MHPLIVFWLLQIQRKKPQSLLISNAVHTNNSSILYGKLAMVITLDCCRSTTLMCLFNIDNNLNT